jgi:hypothetical protein
LAGPDGSVLVSWKNAGSLHWQFFDRNDQPAGKAGSRESPNSSRHTGVVTADGNYLLID